MPNRILTPIIDYRVRELCAKPYPNHPKGCPNYGRKAGCPPHCWVIENIIDLSKAVFAIWNVFDFGAHCRKMKAKHPEWSQRQIECCLYWQPTARQQLRHQIEMFYLGNTVSDMKIIKTPEATGVNVTATMKSIGIELEWPPKTITYQVVLAGLPA